MIEDKSVSVHFFVFDKAANLYRVVITLDIYGHTVILVRILYGTENTTRG
jgi:hypothetical protein